jgi:3-dehydroquinate synthase
MPPAALQITLPDGRGYPIVFAPLAEVPARMQEVGLRKGRCLVVTDAHVASSYLKPLETALEAAGWTPAAFVLPPGESTKSLDHLAALYDWALPLHLDRKTPLLALGGGVVGDIGGFAAATLLRGLPFVQLPTTLIAQVDSALGGKTGVNHPAGKNLIGAFHQPTLVCADLSTLRTLPDREWTSGLAEVVKHGLIADAAFVVWLEAHLGQLLRRDPEATLRMVPRAAAIKAAIVSADEREQGQRALLNFGHTFGHAIEKVAGYGQFTHGEAVALGMRAALHLSHHRFPDFDLPRLDALVRQLPVPDTLATLPLPALMAAMQVDKKAEAGQLRFVLLRQPGEARVETGLSPAAITAAWNAIRNG